MLTITSLLHRGCTRAADASIQALRAEYASERNAFHSFFPRDTITSIQTTLRDVTRKGPETETRRQVVRTLLRAQRTSPHALWEALLIQAFERTLVKRRRALSREEDGARDQLVVATFTATLENLPWGAGGSELRKYVLAKSRSGLARARRDGTVATVPAPVASGVVLAGTYADPTEVA